LTLHYKIITTLIGIIFASIILFLIRKDKLYVRYSLWWAIVATAIIGLGAFPGIIDIAGDLLGISYPPVLAITLAICLLLVKTLTMDIERSRHEREIRILTQRLALLEAMKPGSDGEAQDG